MGRNNLRTSLNHLQRFESVLNTHGWSLRQFRSILDFGCGHGRLARHLFRLVPNARIYGVDISSRAIAWCRRQFPNGHFVLNQPTPPILIADDQFDFIFSYSVFTHLSEPNHQAWLKELSRMLKPGGVMLHTTHSYQYLKRVALFSPERLAAYGLGRSLGGSVDAFIASGKGYHYLPAHPVHPEYGYTILSRDYVIGQWSEYSGLDLVDYVDGAIEAYPEGCQDLVVLAKPQRTMSMLWGASSEL